MRRLALPVAVLSLLLAACDPASVTSSSPASAPASRPAAPVKLGDYDNPADPKTEIRTALAAAAKDGRPVLVDFGADWCPDCVVLGKLAAEPDVAPSLAKFHVVSVDVGRFDKNLDLAKSLTVDLDASGIPALVVLDPTGKVRLATNDGSFSDARTMSTGDVAAFLQKWA